MIIVNFVSGLKIYCSGEVGERNNAKLVALINYLGGYRCMDDHDNPKLGVYNRTWIHHLP